LTEEENHPMPEERDGLRPIGGAIRALVEELRPEDAADLKRAALLAAKMRGCTCEPDIVLTRVSKGLTDATVMHDDDCPVIEQIEDAER